VDQPSEAVLEEQLVRQAVKYLTEDEALTADRGFKPVTFIKAGCKRMAPRRATFILRRPKNFTARRRTAPTYAGRGRKPWPLEAPRPVLGAGPCRVPIRARPLQPPCRIESKLGPIPRPRRR